MEIWEYLKSIASFISPIVGALSGAAFGWYLSQESQKEMMKMQQAGKTRDRRERDAKKAVYCCLKICNFYSITEFNARKELTPKDFHQYKIEEKAVEIAIIKLQMLILINGIHADNIEELQKSLSFIKNYMTIWYEQKESGFSTDDTERKIIECSKDIEKITGNIISEIRENIS